MPSRFRFVVRSAPVGIVERRPLAGPSFGTLASPCFLEPFQSARVSVNLSRSERSSDDRS
jgi:hypothetical protein